MNDLFKEHEILIMVGGSGLFCKAIWEGLDELPIIDPGLRSAINEEVSKNGLVPLLAELLKNDPVYFNQVDQQNPMRIKRAIEVIRSTGHPFSSFHGKAKAPRPFENLKIGIYIDRKVLYQNIDLRMEQMIKKGLFEEVKSLTSHQHLNALKTLGYTEVFGYYEGKYDHKETIRLLKRNSRRYAKRQLTWFQKDPEIKWVDPNEGWDRILDQIEQQLYT
jgi:tRNA dimethylallyltransferase